MLTKEEITQKLKSVQNRFNKIILDDEEIERRAVFMIARLESGKIKSEEFARDFLDATADDYYRELVKEYDHVVISKGKYGKYYIHPKIDGKLYNPIEKYVSERLNTTVEMVYETAEKMNKIYTEKCITTQVEFPTGHIIFANFFKNLKEDDYAFDMPEDLKYKSQYSINYDVGQLETANLLSKLHGLGYVQLGNTSADIYKIGRDKIVLTSSFAYFINDEGLEVDMPVPGGWEHVGEICCNVWRVEFIDLENFSRSDNALPIDHKGYEYGYPVECKVNPGIWMVKNSYHHMDDQDWIDKGKFPVWCELTRIK